MTTADLFEAFDAKIKLGESAQQAGLARIIECVNKLAAKYYSDGEEIIKKITLIGSMAKGTGIKPLHDADVLFHMPGGTYARFSEYSGNGQSALLQEVRETLKQKYPYSDIRGDGPVVTVKFTDEPWVEIVPAVLVSDDANILYADVWVPVTTDGGTWEKVGYGAQLKALDEADNRLDGQVRRLIRYTKAWRKNCDATLKSIVLELMAIDFARHWPTDRSSPFWDDWIVRDFLQYMIDHSASTYPIPGSYRSIGTGVGWLHPAMTGREDAVRACGYKPEDSSYRFYWRKVFGDEF